MSAFFSRTMTPSTPLERPKLDGRGQYHSSGPAAVIKVKEGNTKYYNDQFPYFSYTLKKVIQ